MNGACNMPGTDENGTHTLVRQSEGERSLDGPWCTWEGSNKIYLIRIRWEGVACIRFAWGRNHWRAVANTVTYLQVP
jgi:hypothetical protein